MTLLAYPIGLGLPAVTGWMLLRVLEGRTTVLLRTERWVLGLVLGLDYGMFIAFLLHHVLGMPLGLPGYLAAYAFVLAPLTIIIGMRGGLQPGVPSLPASPPLRTFTKILAVLLGLWITVKIVAASVTFLLLTPTFLDDSLDNWNLRGKVFFVDHALTLVMPGEDPVSSPKGVSSYPPTVPMVKAWLALLAGEWSDPVVNGVHAAWYLSALALMYAFVRRVRSRGWAMVGVYLLSSLPLYFMHGTNAYADAYLSVHVLAAVGMAWLVLREADPAKRMALARVSAICAAILPFTKNEGLLVYLPPLLLIVVLGTLLQWLRGRWKGHEALQVLAWYGVCVLLVAGPWLAFKWMNGLTFGNGKPFTSLGFTWQPNVLSAIFVNTFFEGNWLLLFPLFFLMLLWKWRAAFGRYSALTLFFLIVYCGQAFLYMFTSLSVEALRQTGYARGLVHLVPMVVVLTTLLLAEITSPRPVHSSS